MDFFLYDRDLSHESVKKKCEGFLKLLQISPMHWCLSREFYFDFFRATFLYFFSLLGAHGNCHREGTKLKCTGTFKGRPFAVKTDVKVCHNPVETDIEFKILNKIYTKHYTGNQDFYLQRLSIDQYERKAYLLNVNVKPLSNGDRKITVSSQPTFYLFKSNRNIRKRCEICSKLTIKTPERRQLRRLGVFEHVSHFLLVFLLLTLNM